MELKQALEITKKSKKFIYNKINIDGYEIISFDYQNDTKYKDFLEYNAFELRGLTYVNGERFPMLHKFFNLGEKDPHELEEVKSKKIKSIQIKDDGSLIGFIVLENGRILPKTKMGFSNSYTDIAEKWLLEKPQRMDMVRNLYYKGIYPLFECVSPEHKIVLSYEKEDLKLIQARRKDLTYLTVKELKEIADKYDLTFEEPLEEHSIDILLSLKDTEQNIEGFIVRFEDDTFVKVKTYWYVEQHKSNEVIDRVNLILKDFFEGKDSTQENFERKFIEDAFEKVFKPFNINSVQELKSFLFRATNQKDVSQYRQIFKEYVREYKLLYNYDSESSIIRLIIDNSIDDALPLMTDEQREKTQEIQEIISKFLDYHTDRISYFLEKGLMSQETVAQLNKYKFKNYVYKFLKKGLEKEQLENELKEFILKKTKKKTYAQKFLKENSSF